MSIILKYTDYSIYGIEFFIEKIKADLLLRDLSGLTNGKVEIINILKEHPIVAFFASNFENPKDVAQKYSGIIPGIGVTPADLPDEGETLSVGLNNFEVTQDWLDEMNSFDNQKVRTQQGQVTQKMIDDVSYYIKKNERVLGESHKYMKNEGINISVWSMSPDMDIMLGIMVGGILKDIVTGLSGDESKIRNMSLRTTKGLISLDTGRVLYGCEFAVTFTNTYNNYTLFTEESALGLTFDNTFRIPGEEA